MATIIHHNEERIADLDANENFIFTAYWDSRTGVELDYYNGEFKVMLANPGLRRVLTVSEAERLYKAIYLALKLVIEIERAE